MFRTKLNRAITLGMINFNEPAAASGGDPAQSGAGGSAQPANQNNTPGNIDEPRSIWDNNNNETPASAPASAQPQPARGEVKTPQQQLQEHIKGLNLTNGVNLEQIGTDLQNNSTESLGQALEAIAANAYQAAMMNTNQLMQKKMQDLQQTTQQETMSQVHKDMAVSTMHEQLPYTEDPNIAPIADMVLTQFMEKHGKSLKEAITATNDYFKKAGQKVNEHSPFVDNKSGRPFTGSSQNPGKQSNEGIDDWLDVLAPGSPTND